MKRFAGLLALVAVLGLGIWLALGGRETRGRTSPASAGASDAVPSAAAQPSSTPVKTPEVAPPAAPPAEAGPGASNARAAVASSYEEELARGRWVEGRVVFPGGTPLDEKATVIAMGKKFEHGERHRGAVAADGRFRVAFSEKTKVGQLALEARYVYLPEVAHWKASAAAAPVTLEPRLGGRIEGKLVLPAGARAESGGKIVLRTTVKEGNRTSSSEDKPQDVGADLAFAFGGLDPEASYSVSYDGPTFVGGSAQFPLEPGRARALELVLRPGIVLAGHVRDDAGQALSGVEVVANVQDRSNRSAGNWRTAKSADDGSFHLPALSAGDIELKGSLKGFSDVQRNLGKLAEGEQRADLELVLAHGNSLAGHVLWPDGTPAEAWVAAADEKERDFVAPGDDHKTAADGSFQISGLGEGPFRVSARGKHVSEVTVKSELTGHEHKKKEYQTMRCETEHVAAGTSDLVLTLSLGLSVSGRVLDETGASVGEFVISARHSNRLASWNEMIAPLSKTFLDAGGAFELEGFSPGSWELTATAKGYADSKPVAVDVPSAAPVELVVAHAAALRGFVLDPHGAPVAGAVLSVDQEWQDRNFHIGGDTHKSDERGAFAVDRLSPGPVTLTARASGWAPNEPLTLELAAGQMQDGVVLNLRTGGTIRGEVLGAHARPEVEQNVYVRGQEANFWDNTESDAQGRFEFSGVPAGAYTVQADTSDGLQLSAEITLGVGENGRVRLAPPEGTLVKLHGHVTIGGRAAGKVSLSANREGEDEGPRAPQSSAQSDSDGAYELTVSGSGRYRLFLYRYEGDLLSWNATVDVPETPEFAYDIAVQVGRVRGRVTSRDGAPLAGVLVESAPEHDEEGRSGEARTHTDSDGRYELCAGAGPLAVVAGGRDWSSRDSAPSWAEARVTGLVVAADQTLEGVDFVLSAGGTLEGRVRRADGAPVGRAMLFKGAGAQQDWLGSTDETGHFRIQGLERGTLLVGASSESGTTQRPLSVAIEPGQTSEIELTLVPAAAVHVLVQDAAGASVPCDITLLDGDGQPRPVNRSRKDGEAWIGPLTAGKYTLRAERDEKHAERVLEIRGDEEKPLEIVLTLE